MSKLGDKERKKLRRTAFELHLQDDQLIDTVRKGRIIIPSRLYGGR